jgi:hypothetical protein
MLKPVDTPVETSRTADEGDVPNSVLGVGYDEAVLDRELELEELAEAELGDRADQDAASEDDVPALPGEGDPGAPEDDGSGARRPRPAAPTLPAKLLRTFAFAFLAALVTALLPIADQLADGQKVDISVLGSLALAAIAGAIAAGLRAVTALAPVFPDDDMGLRKRSK